MNERINEKCAVNAYHWKHCLMTNRFGLNIDAFYNRRFDVKTQSSTCANDHFSRAGKARLADALMPRYYVQHASLGLLISEAAVISKDGVGWQENPVIV